MSNSSGEAIQVSYTVATLDARSKMARMRTLLSRPGYQDGDALREAIAAELDNLTDVLTDAYKRVDGMVDDESYCSRVEQLQSDLEDAEKQATEEEEKRQAAESRLEELLQAAEETPDAVQSRLTVAIAKQVDHDVELARMKSRMERAEAQCKQERTDAEAARAALNAANYRMASWSTDKKAVETADHYRIKYEEAMKELGNLKGTYRNAINLAYADAARSKVKREAIRSVESGVESLLRLR